MARELLGDVRTTVGEMRERPTDLGTALRGMVEGLPGLDVEIETDPGLSLGESEQIALIRLAQETVTNTLRHAGATRLRIEVSAQDGDIVLLARDDGAGAGELALGNGLRGLRERFGGFCEEFTGYGGEDTDFAMNLSAHGVALQWVGGADAYHQWHPVSSPPVEHLDDILRNAEVFARRWGWWPMEGWFRAFEQRGLVVADGPGWRRAGAPDGAPGTEPVQRVRSLRAASPSGRSARSRPRGRRPRSA